MRAVTRRDNHPRGWLQVPLDLKLLWVDVMEIVWVTILSKVANQDEAEGGEEASAMPPRT